MRNDCDAPTPRCDPEHGTPPPEDARAQVLTWLAALDPELLLELGPLVAWVVRPEGRREREGDEGNA